MTKLRKLTFTLLAGLLAATAYAGEDTDPGRARYAYPADSTQVTPRENCPLTCKVLRVSTRCECPIRRTLTTASV